MRVWKLQWRWSSWVRPGTRVYHTRNKMVQDHGEWKLRPELLILRKVKENAPGIALTP
jgi:hypothetical protein